VLPQGLCPETLANEVLCSLIDGRRACSATSKEELCEEAKSALDSVVSKLVRAPENRLIRTNPVLDGRSLASSSVSRLKRGSHPLDAKIEAAEVENLEAELQRKLEKDPLGGRLLECVRQGYTKPAEIAILLDEPVGKIYDAQVRMRRATQTLLQDRKRVKS
jgi:hypothetical protein